MKQLRNTEQPLNSPASQTIVDVDELMHSLYQWFNVVTMVDFGDTVKNQVRESLGIQFMLSAYQF